MAELIVATWNPGDDGTKAEFLEILSRVHVLACQEMGDRDALYQAAQGEGWRFAFCDGKDGKKATPLFYDPGVLDWQEDICEKLSDAQHVNPGPGPEDIKTKWAIGARFHYPGRENAVRIVSCHLVAGPGKGGKREDVHHQEVTRLADFYDTVEGVVVIAGDMNANHGSKYMKPMRNKGWQCNQDKQGGPLATHGDNTYDQVWFRNCQLAEPFQATLRTASDHKALGVLLSW